MKMGYVLGGVIVAAGIAAFVASGGPKTTASPEHPPATAPAAEQEPGGAQPADTAANEQGGYIVAGEVLETMDAGGYTYMRVGKSGTDGEWVAVTQTKVEKGQLVKVRADTLMTDFESPTLKRKFASIRFGSMADDSAPTGAMPPGHPQMAGTPGMASGHPNAPGAPDVKVGKVDKAEGPDGRTISEIFAQKSQLTGKKVRVRGTVVKLTSGILGKNFIHLRDGSGSEAKKDHDLTLTTQENLSQGQTALLEGTITLDRDIGAGYKYDVLLEDAVLVK
jgi:hypothetical protein